MDIPLSNIGAVNAEIAAELLAAYERVVASNCLVLGEEVETFEEQWAQYCDKAYAVGVGNAYDALLLILRAYGIGHGDEVIVPANTYAATWLAVTAAGALPVPVDPDPLTHNIDPANVRAARTWRTAAILAVHLYGRPADMAILRELANDWGVPLLVDAAQAHGICGDELGDAAAFSFYPTKNLGALGDGGAVVTDDPHIYRKIHTLRNYGSSSKNVHTVLGVNSRLDEMQAAFLNVKLPYLDKWNNKRKINAESYGGTGRSVWHQYVMCVSDRLAFRNALSEYGVQTMVHYPTPPHLQEAYSYLGYKRGAFPVSERLADQVVSIPVGPELNIQQREYVKMMLEFV